MKIIYLGFATLFAVSGCATTSVTPVAKNQVIISTSAAPACGRSGAAKVAARMAAVETLRRGYQRFTIVGTNSANNTQIIRSGPTYANTYSSASFRGNSMYGNSTTYFGGQQTFVVGSHDAELLVVMFKQGEAGFNNAVDAKFELGGDWEELVKEGVNSCS
jgi:hypothetical protein